jgi:hypothetical protein
MRGDTRNLSGYLSKLECYAESVGVFAQIGMIFRMVLYINYSYAEIPNIKKSSLNLDGLKV